MPDASTTTLESQPLLPSEVRRALNTSLIAWGILGSAGMALVIGAPYVTFAREKLHVSTFMFGLLCSVPYLGVVAQLLGSYLAERTRQRRLLCLTTLSAGRSVWLLVALMPWVIPESLGGLRIAIFIGLVLLNSIGSNISSPAGFSWFADIVPENIRARYLSKRAAVSTTTVVLVSAAASWVIDHNHSFTVFSAIFGLAAFFGLADVNLYCWTVREPPMAPHEGPPWRMRNVVLTPLRERPFRRYLLYAFSEAFMNGLIGPFYWLMSLEFLKTGALYSSLYVMMLPMVFSAIALPVWGGLCDRLGAKPLIKFGVASSLVYPVLWVLARPGHFHVPLAAAAVIGGLLCSSIQAADMSMMYLFTPREKRSAFIAVLMLASNLGYAIAPILGGAIGTALKPVSFHTVGLTFGYLHILMFISIAVSLFHLTVVIPRLPEDRVEIEPEMNLPSRDA